MKENNEFNKSEIYDYIDFLVGTRYPYGKLSPMNHIEMIRQNSEKLQKQHLEYFLSDFPSESKVFYFKHLCELIDRRKRSFLMESTELNITNLSMFSESKFQDYLLELEGNYGKLCLLLKDNYDKDAPEFSYVMSYEPVSHEVIPEKSHQALFLSSLDFEKYYDKCKRESLEVKIEDQDQFKSIQVFMIKLISLSSMYHIFLKATMFLEEILPREIFIKKEKSNLVFNIDPKDETLSVQNFGVLLEVMFELNMFKLENNKKLTKTAFLTEINRLFNFRTAIAVGKSTDQARGDNALKIFNAMIDKAKLKY